MHPTASTGASGPQQQGGSGSSSAHRVLETATIGWLLLGSYLAYLPAAMRRFPKLGLVLVCLLPVLMGVECDRDRPEGFVYRPPVPPPPATPGIEFYFRPDGSEGVRGILEPGSSAVVNYDLSRFDACEPSELGFEALAFVRPKNGDWVEHPLTVSSEGYAFPLMPRIFIPSADEIQFTFFATNNSGCTVEDPPDGSNYRFPVAFNRPRALITFGASGAPTVSGVLRSEAAVTVDYPVDRLPRCRASRDGVPTWRVDLEYTINQITDSVGLTALEPTDEVRQTPGGFILPPASTVIELRFRNTDHTGCMQLEPATGPGFLVDVLP